MGKPADRVKGVSLVTDYGALDRALEIKEAKERKEVAIKAKNVPDYTEYWEGA